MDIRKVSIMKTNRLTIWTTTALTTLALTACGGAASTASPTGAASDAGAGASGPAMTESQAPSSEEATSSSDPGSDATATTMPSDPGEEPSKTRSEPPVHPPQKEQSNHGDAKFEFDYFTVEVMEAPKEPKKIEGVSGVYVKACLKELPEEFVDAGKVPINRSAWSQTVFTAGEQGETVKLEPVDDGYEPAYPKEGELAKGECAEGFISAKEQPDVEIDGLLVEYQNSLGAKASWSYD